VDGGSVWAPLEVLQGRGEGGGKIRVRSAKSEERKIGIFNWPITSRKEGGAPNLPPKPKRGGGLSVLAGGMKGREKRVSREKESWCYGARKRGEKKELPPQKGRSDPRRPQCAGGGGGRKKCSNRLEEVELITL